MLHPLSDKCPPIKLQIPNMYEPPIWANSYISPIRLPFWLKTDTNPPTNTKSMF